jgi:hypothetical protein
MSCNAQRRRVLCAAACAQGGGPAARGELVRRAATWSSRAQELLMRADELLGGPRGVT